MRGRVIIGRNIRALRVAQDLSGKRLADLCGYSHDWLAKVERGQMNITIDRVDVIASALGVTLAQLVAPVTEDPPAPLKGGRRRA